MKRPFAIACIVIALSGAAQASPPFHGSWRTPVDGGGIVRLEACGQKVCGYVVDAARLRENPDQQDIRNKDASLRTRPLRGLKIIEARSLDAARLGDGWVYNPEDGNTYSGSITQLQNGQLRLERCVVWPFCQTQIWRRAD